MRPKSCIPFLPLVLLCGCLEYPSDRLVSLPDFQDSLPKNNIAALAEMKRLTLADARKFALMGNPDYRSAQHAVSVAKYRYYRSLSAYLPEVNFHGAAGQSLRNSHDLLNPPAGIMPQENRFSSQLGVTASLLVFDGLEREFTMLAARQERRRSQALDRNAKRLLLRAVAFAYYDAVLARETERIARADLSFQESSLRQAENRFRNGLVSKASVLNFRILASRAKSAAAGARRSSPSSSATRASASSAGCACACATRSRTRAYSASSAAASARRSSRSSATASASRSARRASNAPRPARPAR